MIIICLNFTSVVVAVVIMLAERLIPCAMQEAAAVWLVRPFCCSPLPNQPDISGRCAHHRQRGPTVSDEGSAQSLVHQNTTHCMKQDVNNQSRIPPRPPSFSSLVFSALVSFIYRLMSEIRSVFYFIFEFPLPRWFWPLMDLGRQKKSNHLLSMMRRCWNWQNSWCDGTVFYNTIALSWHTRLLWLWLKTTVWVSFFFSDRNILLLCRVIITRAQSSGG